MRILMFRNKRATYLRKKYMEVYIDHSIFTQTNSTFVNHIPQETEHKRHCELCDHRLTNLKEGISCKLTKKKPNFIGTCTSIKFGFSYRLELQRSEEYYDLLKASKSPTYIQIAIYFILGSLVLFFGRNIWRSNYDNVRFIHEQSEYAIFIIAFGFLIISIAAYKLQQHLVKIQRAKYKINELKEILDLYNINYERVMKQRKKT